MRHVLSVDDLTDQDVERILARADELEYGVRLPRNDEPRSVVALLFLEESLRTRIGFAAAAARLGWAAVTIDDLRAGPSSSVESWQDTLLSLAGLADAIVARPGAGLERREIADLPVPFLSAGDRGPLQEHPSQALIDLRAMRQHLDKPLDQAVVALCGDLRMRAARSLLKLLARNPAKQVFAVTLDELEPEAALGASLERRRPWELADVDILYVVGMPHLALEHARRETLIVDERALAVLPPQGIVLCPMPIVDEVTAEARGDSRMRYLAQNRSSTAVRMALLEFLLPAPPSTSVEHG